MSELERHVRAVQRRCNAGVYLGRLRVFAAAALGVAAVAVLAERTLAPGGSDGRLWLLVGLAPAAAVAAWLDARRRFFGRDQAVGWLDRLSRADGLVLAVEAIGGPTPAAPSSRDGGQVTVPGRQVEPGEWLNDALAAIRAPRRLLPAFRLRRWSRLVPWVGFLVGALLVPQRPAPADPTRFATVAGAAVARLQARLEQAERLGLLTEPERDELTRTIGRLGGQSAGAFDQRNWQALDAANQRLDARLGEANAALDAVRPALDRAASASGPGTGDEARQGDATTGGRDGGAAPSARPPGGLGDGERQQLAAALERLARSPLANAAPPELKRQLAELRKRQEAGQDPLPQDPAEVQKLLEEASRFLDDLDAQMRREGQREGQADPGQRPAGRGELDPQANLDDFKLVPSTQPAPDLHLVPGGCPDGEGDGADCSEPGGPCGQPGAGQRQGPDGPGMPGRGGIGRGPGDAPMLWGPESSADGARFAPRRLPNDVIVNPDSGQTIGVSIADPQPGQPDAAMPGPARTFDPTTGGRTHRQDYSPAYRGPVRRYFQEP